MEDTGIGLVEGWWSGFGVGDWLQSGVRGFVLGNDFSGELRVERVDWIDDSRDRKDSGE